MAASGQVRNIYARYILPGHKRQGANKVNQLAAAEWLTSYEALLLASLVEYHEELYNFLVDKGWLEPILVGEVE